MPLLALQRYMEMGSAFLEHVASLGSQSHPGAALGRLSSVLYNYTDDAYVRAVETPEMLAALHATAMLARR